MSTDRDLARSVRSWLKEDRHEDADRVLNTVLAELDATPQRRSWWSAASQSRLALAAAAVVVVAFIGYQVLLGLNVGGPGPTPTAEPTSSTAPSAAPEELPVTGLLEPGDYTFRPPGGTGLRGTLTVPAGWHGFERAAVLKNDSAEPPDGAGLASWAGDLIVYGDPCQWGTTRPDAPVGPTVDDLVAALVAQPMRDATSPTEIVVHGYAGTAIELTVPADLDFATCWAGEFRSWTNTEDAARFHQGPGQHDRLWIIDVDGIRVVIDAGFYDGTSTADMAELQAILDSIQFRQ